MNKCHVTKQLSSCLDNQLSEKKRIKIEEHIKSCKVCSQELISLKAVSEKLKAWQLSGPDNEFDNIVRNKIVRLELERGQVKMKNKTWAILIPSGALAGILVVAFMGVMIKSGHQLTREYYKAEVPVMSAEKPASRINQSSGYENWKHKHVDLVGFAGSDKRDVSFVNGVTDNLAVQIPEDGDISTYYRHPKEKMSKNLSTKQTVSPKVSYEPRYDTTVTQAPVDSAGEGPVIVIQPVIPATGEGDKIIRTGFIQVEVENGKEAYNKALGICNELGGYMAGSNFYKTREGKEAGTITMRIPKDKFTIALDKLSTLGKLENINTDSQDVSQEYSNFKSQLDAAMVVYNKMLEALQKRNVTISDAVRLESELTPVLKRVDDLKNKIEYLNKSVAYTTVNFDFYESAVSFKTLKESRRFIQESMITAAIKAIKFIAVAIPVLIVVIILVGIITVVGLAVKQWIKQLLKRG